MTITETTATAKSVDTDSLTFLTDLVLRSLAAAVDDVLEAPEDELGDEEGALVRLIDNIVAVAEGLVVVEDHASGEYVRPAAYRGPETAAGVARHVEALLRFAAALPKPTRPRNARERVLRMQERAAYLAPWKKRVLGDLRADPTSRSWESRADAPQRLYLVAWKNWVKLGHGTDARVRQHLANPDCEVLQVVEASHLDITHAERILRHRFAKKRKPGRNIKLQMPRSFGAGRELVPYRDIADFDLVSVVPGGARDVTSEY
ncbi:hypothetical protein [Pseudonocardia pini]|uniref:hypothetical protein n=1 Tax=Pseudonocardia pini TaxID=2758030 RepID=UPI0015F0FFBC|nr:hypothetical protein [Pseudonocardia pini]